MDPAPPAEGAALGRTASPSLPVADFAELVKARLTLLVLLTTAVGFYLGAPVGFQALELFHVVFGTALAAAGAAALNQWWEYQLDALMHRTRTRPIPGGRMLPRDGFIVGVLFSAAGVAYLSVACNLLSALLAAATIAIYLFCYTPLKRISTANTLVGAIPGALPPMIGWAAARNEVGWPAWSLFAILFCWQMPHFFAIAWMYREDYARAGFRMLSGSDLDGARSGRQSVIFALLLLGASGLPALLGLTSPSWLLLGLLAGAGFLTLAIRFALRRELPEARGLFLGSIIYLPLLLTLLVLAKK
ncbi:MAG: protoheme IX farnesyltransferase [Chthoniobacterales bacterium]|nr:protoheme IX farnesyltransferase [Chthoniobacterales bacterium]